MATATESPRTSRTNFSIEIDMSSSVVDRPEIYATLGVPEVWRFDGREFRIDRLRDDGTYAPADSSLFVPIRPDEVVRWVVAEGFDDDNAWARQVRAWVRAELAARA